MCDNTSFKSFLALLNLLRHLEIYLKCLRLLYTFQFLAALPLTSSNECKPTSKRVRKLSPRITKKDDVEMKHINNSTQTVFPMN